MPTIAAFTQRADNVCRRFDQPDRAGAPAAELARCRIQVVVEHLAMRMRIKQPALAHGVGLPVIVPASAVDPGHFGDLRLGEGPGLLGRITDQRRDPKPEFQWRQIAVESPAQLLQPFEALTDALERLAPEKLEIGFSRSDTLRRLRADSLTEKCSPTNVAFSSVHSRRTSRMNSLVRAYR